MLEVAEWGLVDGCESPGVELVEEGDLKGAVRRWKVDIVVWTAYADGALR